MRSASRSSGCGGRWTTSWRRPGPTRRPRAAPARATSVAASADGLARTLRRLHAERGVTIDVSAPPAATCRVEREDLDEMLGNLLDNACKWARSRAVLAASIEGDRVVVTIDDDGPGIAPSLRDGGASSAASAPTRRRRAPGSACRSCATSRAPAAARSSFADAPIGGLRVRLDLPAADPGNGPSRYSIRRQTAGSTRRARRAGTHDAASATASRPRTGSARLEALSGSTSYRSVRTNPAK